MNGTELAAGLRSHGGHEVYLRTADGHQLVVGTRAVRYNDNGPLIVEVVTDTALLPEKCLAADDAD